MLIACMHALAASALAVWVGLQMGWGGVLLAWLAGLAWVAVATGFGARLARRALPADGARLNWDGAGWTLTTRGSSDGTQTRSVQALRSVPIKQLVVTLDLGAWLLLRLQAEAGGRRWQAVRAACVGPAWHGLRVALLTQAGPLTAGRAQKRHGG